jgi:hypothetical protein
MVMKETTPKVKKEQESIQRKERMKIKERSEKKMETFSISNYAFT